MLTEEEVKNQYGEILNHGVSDTEKALELFLFISKNQIFWDGNKRTALLTANKIMFNKGLGLFSIPETVFEKFNELLFAYYNSEKDIDAEKILNFMCSNCIFGITYR